MKKLMVGVLACASVMAVSTISFGTTGKVNTDTARVRSEASANSSIIDLLSIDDKVEIIDETGDWYKVKSESQTGYVSKSLIDVEKTEETNTSTQNQTSTTENTETKENTEEEKKQPEETTEKQEETTTVKISESFTGKLLSEVTIKILPSINSMDIAKIEKDSEIKIVEVINEWCHLETKTHSGWARIKLVENAVTTEKNANSEEINNEEEKTETPEETKQTKIGYVNVESVNLRKEKSTSSEKLDSLTKNTEVKILSEEDDWYKVSVNNLTGYISKKYISDKKVEEVTSRASDTARQISDAKEVESTTESSANSTANASSGTKGSEIVAFAKQYLGSKYVSGGSSPSTGFDCSGFTSYVYKNFGVSISRTSSGQRSNGVGVNKSELQQGDIVCFTGHVGIYIGNNQFIHASNPTGGVKITSLSDSYYVKNYITSRRVLE